MDEKVLTKLQKEFSFYKNDKEYFLNIIKTYKIYDKCLKIIICDLKNDWEKLNVQWFVDYLKNSKNSFLTALGRISSKLSDYQINIDIETLEKIFNKYPELDNLFKEIFENKDKVTYNDIEVITNDVYTISVLMFYTILKGIYIEDSYDDEVKNTRNDDNFYDADIVKQYLIEIRNIPILPQEEVLDIFYNIDILNQKLNDDLATEEKEKIKKEINLLKSKIIESNLRLVVKRASKFSQAGRDLMDIIQEGNKGLINAVNHYDYQKGYSFTTYATYWIFQAIQRYIENFGRTIRLPVIVNNQLSKINRTKANLANRLGREPTSLEIANELNLKEADINNLLNCPEIDVFLDAPVKKNEENNLTMGHFIASKENLEEEVFKRMLPEYINDAISKYLTEKEEKIIRLHFGIQEPGKENVLYERKHTLKELGDMFCVSGERIRQIEKKALKKLRRHVVQLYDHNNKVKKESGSKNMLEEDLKTKRELYLEKIKLLSEEDRNYVFLRYGKDLTERNILDSNHTKRAYSALRKAKRMIDDPNYVPKIKGQSKSKNGPVIKIVDGKRSLVYLKDKLKCSQEDIINLAFCLLTEDNMDILYNYYGATLSNAINEVNLQENIYETLEKLYEILLTKLPNLQRPIYLKDVLKISEDDIVKLKESLNKGSVKYKCLSKVYGEDLLQKEKNLSDLNAHELNLLLISLKDIRKQIKNNSLTNSKKLKIKRTNKNIKEGQLLKNLLSATDNEMNYLLTLLRSNSIMYKVLQKIYGENLDQPATKIELSIKERRGYCNALAKLRKKLKEYRDNNQQKEATERGKIEVKEINKNVVEEQQEFVIKESKSNNMKNLKSESVSTEEHPPNIAKETNGTNDVMLSPLKDPFFKEFINILPLKYRLISALRLGLYDGNIHSIQEIALMFNVSEDAIIMDLSKLNDLFLTFANRYQELYNFPFPSFNGESIMIKKLSKN